MLAALLIGLAATIELTLQRSLVLDTVIDKPASLVNGKPPAVVASGIMVIEAILHLAFLLGNGIMGIVNPASGLTLAFLAISRLLRAVGALCDAAGPRAERHGCRYGHGRYELRLPGVRSAVRELRLPYRSSSQRALAGVRNS